MISSSVRVSPGRDDDEGLDRFAPVFVRDADGAGLEDLRMAEEDLVDLLGVDVVAAGDDHVLLAVHEGQMPVLVQEADVPRVEPAVAEGVFRLLGLLVVARHELGPLDADLARLARRQLLRSGFQIDDLQIRIGQRHADGPRLRLPLPGGAGGEGGVLGEAVDVVDLPCR